jgi:hypothetical protein
VLSNIRTVKRAPSGPSLAAIGPVSMNAETQLQLSRNHPSWPITPPCWGNENGYRLC